MNIQVSIADDHPMIIDGLQSILPFYPHIQLIGCYANGVALLSGLEIQIPDVLLMDIQMPDITGDELTPIILKKYPALKILVLTNFDSALYANNMFKRGAHGYLLKTADRTTLIKAIETVYMGNEFLEEDMSAKIREMDIQDRNSTFSKTTLTPREKEVLQLIVDGLTAPEIAKKIFLSLGTVANYRTSIMLKLDVNNTASLVKRALKLGLAQ
ncbi:MAG: response regulator transcription factor [Taibaiella sp.]|jgi:two-component system secretion response regulator SsrB